MGEGYYTFDLNIGACAAGAGNYAKAHSSCGDPLGLKRIASLDAITSFTSRVRAEDLMKSLDTSALMKHLLSNMPPIPKLTRWQRFKRTLGEMPYRIRGAWLVLTDRADYEEYP